MRRKKWVAVLVLLLLALVYLWYTGRLDTEGDVDAAAVARYAPGTASAKVDQLLVDLSDDLSDDEVARLARRYRLEMKLNSRFSRGTRLYRAKVRRNLTELLQLIKQLRADPKVERAELDATYGIPPLEAEATRFVADDGPADRFPNDPKYRYQWHMRQIGMEGGLAPGERQGSDRRGDRHRRRLPRP